MLRPPLSADLFSDTGNGVSHAPMEHAPMPAMEMPLGVRRDGAALAAELFVESAVQVSTSALDPRSERLVTADSLRKEGRSLSSSGMTPLAPLGENVLWDFREVQRAAKVDEALKAARRKAQAILAHDDTNAAPAVAPLVPVVNCALGMGQPMSAGGMPTMPYGGGMYGGGSMVGGAMGGAPTNTTMYTGGPLSMGQLGSGLDQLSLMNPASQPANSPSKWQTFSQPSATADSPSKWQTFSQPSVSADSPSKWQTFSQAVAADSPSKWQTF